MELIAAERAALADHAFARRLLLERAGRVLRAFGTLPLAAGLTLRALGRPVGARSTSAVAGDDPIATARVRDSLAAPPGDGVEPHHIKAVGSLSERRLGRRRGDRHAVGRAAHVVEPSWKKRRSSPGRRRARRRCRASGRAWPRGPHAPAARASPRPARRSSRTGCGRRSSARCSARALPSTSSREKPSAVWVRSLVPNEKKSACSAIRSATKQARAARSSCRSAGASRSPRPPPRHLVDQLAHQLELLLVGDQRDHDLEQGGSRAPTASAARRSRGPASRRSRGGGRRAARRACRASGWSPPARARARACARAPRARRTARCARARSPARAPRRSG